jgi:DNA-binding FrmR family transcriptional regulator
MDDTAKRDALKRLAYIEGHLRGVRRMVEDDTYCVDVLHQTHAIQKALEGFEQLLLQGHLRACVPSGIREGREESVLAELADLYGVARRWRTAVAAPGSDTDEAAPTAATAGPTAHAAAVPTSVPPAAAHPLGESHGRRAAR